LDVLAKRPMLVRTFMYKFETDVKSNQQEVKSATSDKNTEQFVIGIDLHARTDKLAPSMASVLEKKVDYLESFTRKLFPAQIAPVHYAAFIASMVFFWVLKSMSSTHLSKVIAKRSFSQLGKVAIGHEVTVEAQQQRNQQTAVALDLKYIPFSKRWTTEEK